MSLALGTDPPWGLIEYLATGVSTVALGALGYVWRLGARVEKVSTAVEWQKAEVAATKQAADAAAMRLSDRLEQHHDDLCRLRETAASLPTRADMRDMEERLGERIATLAARIDGVFAGRSP